MEARLKRRRCLKRELRRCLDMEKTADEELEVKQVKALVNKAYDKFTSHHEDTMEVVPDSEFEQLQEEFDNLAKEYCEVSLRLEKKLQPPINSVEIMTGHGVHIKLPQVELPVFSGNSEDWPSFVDLFQSIIEAHPQLTAAQKLQYLKSAMRGEAAHILRQLPTTHEAYTEAWELLTARYQNTREIVNSQLKRLFHHEVIKGDAPSIRRFLDISNECLRTFTLLKVPQENAVWNFLMSSKMDKETRKEWELAMGKDGIPSAQEIREFLEERARIITNQATDPAVPMPSPQRKKNPKCPACSGPHEAWMCEKFKGLSKQEKEKLVQTARLCYNCLKNNHSARQCVSKGCKRCGKKHHSLLHKDTEETNVHLVTNTNAPSLLPTAWLGIRDAKGDVHKVRALLDTGSPKSFIEEDLVERLKLSKYEENLSWRGVGTVGVGSTAACVELQATSLKTNFPISVKAYITKNMTSNQPPQDIQGVEEWKYIKHLQLADETFFKSQKVEVLLGAAVVADLLKNGIERGTKQQPLAQNTELGWVLFGGPNETNREAVAVLGAYPTLEEQVQQFWQLETIQESKARTEEEDECEVFFKKTFSRDSQGRYIVRLPFKEKAPQPDQHRGVALRRFFALEQKFKEDKNFQAAYVSAIQDFQTQGHMVLASDTQTANRSYLPHHAVIRKDHSTTKLRVVFDASARTTENLSLNDQLMNGLKLQDDLFDILIRFRNFKFAFAADIEKMYRQIKIHPADRNYQRVFWRKAFTEPIREYQLTTVTFGIKPAPYLATRVLQQLAEDEREAYPLGSQILKKDFYVDDLLSGTNDRDQAIKICEELKALLKSGGFNLRKWISNDATILMSISEPLGEELNIAEGEHVKTLGLKWNPATDSFTFNIGTESTRAPTRRTVLSSICRTFDPLGWLAPFTIRGKMLFQELWKETKGWDDPIPARFQRQWAVYEGEAETIPTLTIPRKINPAQGTALSLCGFADASEKAYGAAVFLKSQDVEGNNHVRLIAAKTRVAPLKPISIPRLELNAAVLLARLQGRIAEQLNIQQLHAWTDSTVVLAWIRGGGRQWKPYVKHRVTEILTRIRAENWHHVDSKNNPADCASRGISAERLKQHTLWWTGPRFLRNEDNSPNLEPEPPEDEVNKECSRQEIHSHHANTTEEELQLLQRYSSLYKLLRVTAYVFRVVKRSRPAQIHITIAELRQAELHWVRKVQQDHLHNKIASLRKGKLENTSLMSLCPFLDQDGILRVGGRLRKSELTYNQKHPILLPKQSHLTKLIIQASHKLHCHAGPTLLLTILRQKYWIVNGKNVIRQVTNNCLQCLRMKAKKCTQFMADLPASRVIQNPAFHTCGVDYAGPITLKGMIGRTTTIKGYIALFICFTTRAIHLELVSSLSSEAFVAALRRFIARRGLCRQIYSDQGTNFIGANRELKKMLKHARNESWDADLAKILGELAIEWKFNPPGAPHFGGLWEAGVKSVKTHLHRILGNIRLSFEEMTTVLCQVEACLNSRPLCQLSADPNDLEALTPGHFLIGRPLVTVPEPDLKNHPDNRVTRYQLCQKLTQHFWKRWSREYLSRLQSRPKWMKPSKNLKKGDMVLLMEDNVAPLHWKKGRIIEAHPGSDGLVRVASVRTATGIKTRPIVKLALLPLQEEASG